MREFIAACGIHGTSCATVAQNAMVHEGVPEGPRGIIFDLENRGIYFTGLAWKSSLPPVEFVNYYGILYYKKRASHEGASAGPRCVVFDLGC